MNLAGGGYLGKLARLDLVYQVYSKSQALGYAPQGYKLTEKGRLALKQWQPNKEE